MNRRLFLNLFLTLSFLVILVCTTSVSADLCKGDDGYYHDCEGISKSSYYSQDCSYYRDYDKDCYNKYKKLIEQEGKNEVDYRENKKDSDKKYEYSYTLYLDSEKSEDRKSKEEECYSDSYWRDKETYYTQDYKKCECKEYECVSSRCVRWSRSWSAYYGRRCIEWSCNQKKCVDWDCEDKSPYNYYYQPRYNECTGTYNWRW
jgi:hypothetical protein